MSFATDSPGKHSANPRTLRNRQDAVRFIARFAALTGLVVPSASADGLPAEFLARPVLPPDVLTSRYGRRLRQRTYNALCRFEPVPEGEPWTFGRLLQIRGFGLFCLLDVLQVLSRSGVKDGSARPGEPGRSAERQPR